MKVIDGRNGGGQILRSALSLAMVTGEPVRIKNIRGKRSKPGLMRQHLTCVQAAVEVSGGSADGAEMHSTELVFAPGKVKAGQYEFKIGSAGSTTLLLQTVLPGLLLADGESVVEIHGGTHNPMAPPVDFINACFLPQLRKMGASVEVECVKHGFFPAGGGCIRARVQPIAKWNELELLDRGALVSKSMDVILAHVPESVATREVAAFAKQANKAAMKRHELLELLGHWEDSDGEVREASDADCPGNVFAAQLDFEHVAERVTTYGQRGLSAEAVANEGWKALRGFVGSETAVGVRLADQLLLPMALAGAGRLRVVASSNHIRTNIAVIEQFLDVRFRVDELECGGIELEVK